MTFRHLSEAADELKEWATGDQPRIRLGFPVIDDRTQGGPAPGEVVMVIAFSGVGKTAMACNLAVNVQGLPTVVFSVEMAARALMQRLAAVYTNTPTYVIEQQLRYEHRAPAVERFVADFPHLSIDDNPSQSLRSMGEYLDEAEDEWEQRPKVVIIDYLELLKAPFGAEAGVGAIDALTRGLKNFARARDVVVIVLHQKSMTSAKMKTGPSGHKETDFGHLPVTRHEARYGGDVAADYTLGCYRPALNPALPEDERIACQSDFMVQFLKSRGGSEISHRGEKYHYNLDTLRITPPHRLLAPQLSLPMAASGAAAPS